MPAIGHIRFNQPFFIPPRILPTKASEQVKKGKEEAVKEIIKEDQKSMLKLDELIKRAHKVMLNIKTVFPFKFYPISVVIDANKVDVVRTTFLFSKHIHSVFIKDITDVMVETVPFFATLKIIDSGYIDNSIDIPFLWKEDAVIARRIIQGLVVSAKEGVDLSILDQEALALKMEELGKVSEIE